VAHTALAFVSAPATSAARAALGRAPFGRLN